jgi:hypothetical protein
MFFGSVVGVDAQNHTPYSNHKALMTICEAALGNPREELKNQTLNTVHKPSRASKQGNTNAYAGKHRRTEPRASICAAMFAYDRVGLL